MKATVKPEMQQQEMKKDTESKISQSRLEKAKRDR
jgi:hypothetical protein